MGLGLIVRVWSLWFNALKRFAPADRFLSLGSYKPGFGGRVPLSLCSVQVHEMGRIDAANRDCDDLYSPRQSTEPASRAGFLFKQSILVKPELLERDRTSSGKKRLTYRRPEQQQQVGRGPA